MKSKLGGVAKRDASFSAIKIGGGSRTKKKNNIIRRSIQGREGEDRGGIQVNTWLRL